MAKPSQSSIDLANETVEVLRLGMKYKNTANLDAQARNDHDAQVQMIRDLVKYTKTGAPTGLEAAMISAAVDIQPEIDAIKIAAEKIAQTNDPVYVNAIQFHIVNIIFIITGKFIIVF